MARLYLAPSDHNFGRLRKMAFSMARDEGRSSGSRPPQQITKRSCSCPYVHLILLFFVLHITGYYANIIVGMIVVLSTEVPSWLPIPYSSEVPYNSINCRHLNINFIQKSTNITSESACTSSTWIERLLLAFFLPSFLPSLHLSLSSLISLFVPSIPFDLSVSLFLLLHRVLC